MAGSGLETGTSICLCDEDTGGLGIRNVIVPSPIETISDISVLTERRYVRLFTNFLLLFPAVI